MERDQNHVISCVSLVCNYSRHTKLLHTMILKQPFLGPISTDLSISNSLIIESLSMQVFFFFEMLTSDWILAIRSQKDSLNFVINRRFATISEINYACVILALPLGYFVQDEKLKFIGRWKTNAMLDELATPHFVRPSGSPPVEGYEFCVEFGLD